jgi:hypothetical protein
MLLPEDFPRLTRGQAEQFEVLVQLLDGVQHRFSFMIASSPPRSTLLAGA